MILRQLRLQQFRSYQAKEFSFTQPTTIFVGPNAIGKTSIIEAIVLLATGESFRATKIEEMIGFGQELARVVGDVHSIEELREIKLTDGESKEAKPAEETTELEVLLTTGLVQGKRTQKRLFSVNGVRRRRKDFVGKFFTVVFRPEDMRLIEGSPSRRRNYLDTPMMAISQTYTRALATYDKALRQTNHLLEQVREGRAPRNSLTYWNLTLLKHGELLQEQRRQFTAFINTVSFPLPFSIEYHPSLLNAERLAEYQDRALAAGHMLIGPHKDDITVHLTSAAAGTKLTPHTPDTIDISIYGSRGQQRMAVLWLKVAEQAFLTNKTGQKPMLLLDDILSELDPEVRKKVLSLLPGSQAIITTADASIVPEILEVATKAQVEALAT